MSFFTSLNLLIKINIHIIYLGLVKGLLPTLILWSCLHCYEICPLLIHLDYLQEVNVSHMLIMVSNVFTNIILVIVATVYTVYNILKINCTESIIIFMINL